jgi:hypothetical protein
LGYRVRSRSRTVPRLLAWTAAAMPAQPFACVLGVSLPSAGPGPGWRQSRDHPSSFLSLDLFAMLSDRSITPTGRERWLSLETKTRQPAGAGAALDAGRSLCWLVLSQTGGRHAALANLRRSLFICPARHPRSATRCRCR